MYASRKSSVNHFNDMRPLCSAFICCAELFETRKFLLQLFYKVNKRNYFSKTKQVKTNITSIILKVFKKYKAHKKLSLNFVFNK